MFTALPDLVLRTDSEVLEAIPSILGFHPSDSVVVMLATPAEGVILTARTDLDACLRLEDPSEPLWPALRRIGWRPDLGAIVVAYGDRIDLLKSLVLDLHARLPAREVLGAVVVGSRWWFSDDGPHDPGHPYDPRSSAIEAATVYAGHAVLGSRAEVEARLDPPRGRRPRGVSRAFARARDRVAALPAEVLRQEMGRIVDRLLPSDDPASLDELALLAILGARPEAREACWERLDRSSAASFVSLWLQVVRVTPRRWSVPALCLLGMSAWQAGEGVTLTISLDRACSISPRHELVEILGAISANLLPPAMWHEMRGLPDEAAG